MNGNDVDTINFDYNEPTQFYLDLRNHTWQKQFNFENKQANYVYFPEIKEDRVFINFTTSLKRMKNSTSWLVLLSHILVSSADGFDALYKFVKNIVSSQDIDHYYSNDYTDEVVNIFESTLVLMNKDLPINTTCLWLTAEKVLKENQCDVVIIRQIVKRDTCYQVQMEEIGVYTVENVQMDEYASNYLHPPQDLQRYKIVNSSELQSLLSLEEIEENDSFFRNASRYFAMKLAEVSKQLTNYRNLDNKICKQILDIIATGIKQHMITSMVGKTKRFGVIVPLYQGKYCLKRHVRNKKSIGFDQWKTNGDIQTLDCDETRHCVVFGNEATSKIYSVIDDNGQRQIAFTICLQFSKLKISKIDESRGRVYAWFHVVKMLPDGTFVGLKEKIKRKRNNNNNNEQKEENENENEFDNDEEISFDLS